MTRIKVLNPHGLKMAELWPVLKAIGCTFNEAAALIKGRTLRVGGLKAGIVVRLLNDLGRSVDAKRF